MRKEDVLDTPIKKKNHSTEFYAVVQLMLQAWGPQSWSALEHLGANLTAQETLKWCGCTLCKRKP